MLDMVKGQIMNSDNSQQINGGRVEKHNIAFPEPVSHRNVECLLPGTHIRQLRAKKCILKMIKRFGDSSDYSYQLDLQSRGLFKGECKVTVYRYKLHLSFKAQYYARLPQDAQLEYDSQDHSVGVARFIDVLTNDGSRTDLEIPFNVPTNELKEKYSQVLKEFDLLKF